MIELLLIKKILDLYLTSAVFNFRPDLQNNHFCVRDEVRQMRGLTVGFELISCNDQQVVFIVISTKIHEVCSRKFSDK